MIAMKKPDPKLTKRGFVMTGGGAKGLFEAGVIHAFHLCGMEFDVITGSSIGAINSIFYAEYSLKRAEFRKQFPNAPDEVDRELDALVRAFLHAWWEMPRMGIIDDSETGPLGRLKNDLLNADVRVSGLVRVLWWFTDPHKSAVPGPKEIADATRLGLEVVERLEGLKGIMTVLRRIREEKLPALDATLRTYLARFGMENAIVPDEQATKLRDRFTQSIPPLRRAHLDDPRQTEGDEQAVKLVPPTRRLSEYKDCGVDVRLTRANFRTGRLEVSAYQSAGQFRAFLKKHQFRWQERDGVKPSLGNARLQMVGNPRAIDAALASGRFPGVFSPMAIGDIYQTEPQAGPSDEANALLFELLSLDRSEQAVKSDLETSPESARQDPNEDIRKNWRRFRLFPEKTDLYVDGGAIDNTPANSAIDAIKDWLDANDFDNRGYQLDLYTIFLHPPPGVAERKTTINPSLVETVTRTLDIRSAAVMQSDAATVDFVNRLGDLGEESSVTIIELTEALKRLFNELPENARLQLDDAQKSDLAIALKEYFSAALLNIMDSPAEDVLEDLQRKHKRYIKDRWPLHVNPIEIHPEDMPMITLQFTERLGNKPENVIRMLTSGCYSTLWSLYDYLTHKSKAGLDEMDESALNLARRWMGLEGDLPRANAEELKQSWQCRRRQCVFHAQHCRHGAAMDL